MTMILNGLLGGLLLGLIAAIVTRLVADEPSATAAESERSLEPGVSSSRWVEFLIQRVDEQRPVARLTGTRCLFLA